MKLYEIIEKYKDCIILDSLGREITNIPTDILMHKDVLDYTLNPYERIVKVIVDYRLPTYEVSDTQKIIKIIHYLESLFKSSSEDQAALLNQAIRNLEEYFNDTRAN